MKKLKFGFSTLVAIIAISFTIATQAGIFEKKLVVKNMDKCYSVENSFGIPAVVVNPDDCETSTILEINAYCESVMGWKLFTNVSAAQLLSPEETCPGSTKYCCIMYEIDDNPCINVWPAQGQYPLSDGLNYYKVTQIFCTLP